VLARELAHLRAGDLVCPHATATTESQDDVWTAAEQREAERVARRVYPGAQVARDREATARMLDADPRRTEAGAVLLLGFFQDLEAASPARPSPFLRPSYYGTLHPGPADRLATVMAEARKSP
jgi:hypothetical protein